MRNIGNLPNASQARLFSDYLYAQGIPNQIEPDSDTSWMIWVIPEEKLDTASELLERFRRDPSAPEFARTAAGAEKARKDEAKELTEYRKRFHSSGQIFRSTRTFGAGVLTYILIAVCVVVAIRSHLGEDDQLLQHLFITYPGPGANGFLSEIRAGEIWRLFTPAIIHFGVLHLLFNMLWLFQLGSMIEARQGSGRFALLALILAATSNFAQFAATDYYRFGGMSGVVYGLFGYVWIRGRFDPASGLHIDRQNVLLMIVWLFLCMTGAVGPIANWAHGVGLVVGGGYGFISAKLSRRR